MTGNHTADTIIGATLIVIMATATTAALLLGPGFRTWQRPDQINYAIMTAALWPWTACALLGIDTPHPYNATVLAVGIATSAWFLVRQLTWLHRSQRELAAIQAAAAELLTDHHGDTDE